MGTSFDNSFAELSERCHRHIRAGHIDLYSATLKEMASLLEKDGRFMDEFKILIPAFYIDLSGFGRAPYIDSSVPVMLQSAISNSGIDKQKLYELYSELIHTDMVSKHAMTVSESLYIFKLCIENKVEQAEYILSRI